MTTIRNHPDIRAVAEERARIRFETFYRLNQPEPAALWVDLSPSYREEHIAVELDLLTDLSRPDSFDALVRVLAKRVDWSADDVHGALNRYWQRLANLYLLCGLPEPERHEPTPQPVAALLACLEATEPA